MMAPTLFIFVAAVSSSLLVSGVRVKTATTAGYHDDDGCHGSAKCGNLFGGTLLTPSAMFSGHRDVYNRGNFSGTFEDRMFQEGMLQYGEMGDDKVSGKCNYGYTDVYSAMDTNEETHCVVPCYGHQVYLCTCVSESKAELGQNRIKTTYFVSGGVVFGIGLIGSLCVGTFMFRNGAHKTAGCHQLLCMAAFPTIFLTVGIILLAIGAGTDPSAFFVGCGPNGGHEQLPQVKTSSSWSSA